MENQLCFHSSVPFLSEKKTIVPLLFVHFSRTEVQRFINLL